MPDSIDTIRDIDTIDAAFAGVDLEQVDKAVFPIGEVLNGTYEIRKMIGQGGMAQVFEAHDRWINRRVAIKASRFEASQDPEAASPLRMEAQALGAVRHPGLLTVYGFGRHRDIEYLVLELVHGMSLSSHMAQRLAAKAPLTISEICEILASLADALAAVHRAGGAHRDVKPSNVMLAPGGRLVLMDFGIFRPEMHGNSEMISGTPHYMAPEAIEGRVELGAWQLVDLYGLGIVGYELCTGKRPYEGKDVLIILDQHLNEPVPDVLRGRPDVPPRLRRLLSELMAKAPNDRPYEAESVARRLRAIARDSGAIALGEAPLQVLIVDADEDLLQILRFAVELTLPGTEVRTCRTAQEAIDLFARRLPDVLILDLQLPGSMSGLELCMYQRGIQSANRCTIIPVSGPANDGDLQLLQHLRIDHFVPKGPTLISHLGALLRQLQR
jgi:eukaryotic-like serine/threonine-protein kinase